ncbi:MAG: hypothetical protein N3G19_00385 [Candidatus Pacearchaeota archaeon]|nr:hypothetical protein [Candidatus Pacearchaeota archaeon]
MVKKNKKAGIFAAGMVLATIIFIVTAWFAFSTTNKNITAEIELLPILTSIYNEQDRFSLYINETKKLAASQAFYELTKRGAVIDENCRIEPDTKSVIWDSNCKPEITYINKAFLEEFNETFNFLVNSYPNEKFRQNYSHIFNEQENVIISKDKSQIIENKKEGNFASYTISLSTEKTATITTNLNEQEINLDDFVKIYDKIMEEKSKCSEETHDCLKNFNFENWNVKIEKQGNYYFFELTTKKAFFFIENNNIKFEPIKLKFVLEQH